MVVPNQYIMPEGMLLNLSRAPQRCVIVTAYCEYPGGAGSRARPPAEEAEPSQYGAEAMVAGMRRLAASVPQCRLDLHPQPRGLALSLIRTLHGTTSAIEEEEERERLMLAVLDLAHSCRLCLAQSFSNSQLASESCLGAAVSEP